ncbi:hypothetical protein DPMN_160189 [Dreissena polymorpha]|uniref:Uncharacterized protein n=1 Tax=Dreissena polymorpha TaxID=45954 RepID=A0A9D4EPP2_DREPO|nr:hypothetical protein DPMN_160189 [Dreissena polymorpha]
MKAISEGTNVAHMRIATMCVSFKEEIVARTDGQTDGQMPEITTISPGFSNSFEHGPCRVNNQFFKETSEAWRNLDEHTKKQLTEEAEKIRHKQHEKADIKEVVKQQMRTISDAV